MLKTKKKCRLYKNYGFFFDSKNGKKSKTNVNKFGFKITRKIKCYIDTFYFM